MTAFDRTTLVLNDTAPDAEEVQLRLLREKVPSERAALALRLTSEVRRAAKKAIARAHPEFTAQQVEHRFIEVSYSRELAEAVQHRLQLIGDGRNRVSYGRELAEAVQRHKERLENGGVE